VMVPSQGSVRGNSRLEIGRDKTSWQSDKHLVKAQSGIQGGRGREGGFYTKKRALGGEADHSRRRGGGPCRMGRGKKGENLRTVIER